MKRLKLVGLTLLAAFALGVTAASTAFAEEGYLPRPKSLTLLAGKVLYETHAKEQWLCTKGSASGKFESDSRGTATINFTGCAISGFSTLSLGAEKEVIVIPVSFTICLINSSTLTFGIYLELNETVHVEIPALGVLFELSGSFIGQILSTEGKLFVLDFSGKEGLGNIVECGGKKALFLDKKDPNAALEESVSLQGGLLQFEETVKLMDT